MKTTVIFRPTSNIVAKQRQSGVALVISLVFLLLVTILGLISMRTTTLEESMANNAQDRMVAFQAAEAALRAGEDDIADFVVEPVEVASNPGTNEVWIFNAAALYGDPPDTDVLAGQSATWWQNNTRTYATNLSRVKTQPNYCLEFQTFVPDTLRLNATYQGAPGRNYYRISARGTGQTDDAVVVAQSTTTKRFN